MIAIYLIILLVKGLQQKILCDVSVTLFAVMTWSPWSIEDNDEDGGGDDDEDDIDLLSDDGDDNDVFNKDEDKDDDDYYHDVFRQMPLWWLGELGIVCQRKSAENQKGDWRLIIIIIIPSSLLSSHHQHYHRIISIIISETKI